MRGTISREHPWEVMPDLYFYRDPEEVRFSTCLSVVSRTSGYFGDIFIV